MNVVQASPVLDNMPLKNPSTDESSSVVVESDDEESGKLQIDELNGDQATEFDAEFILCPDGTAYIVRDNISDANSSTKKFMVCDSFTAASQKFSHQTEQRDRVLVCLTCRLCYPTYTPFTTHLQHTHTTALGHQDKLALGNPAVSAVFKAGSLTLLQSVDDPPAEVSCFGLNEDMARNLQLASQLSASRILQQVSQNALVMASVNPFTQAAAASSLSSTNSSHMQTSQCPLVSTPPTAARNSCKTLKCPNCNWHYKYQETLEIHMKEKHSDSPLSPDCSYCRSNKTHPKLARGETYSCGYKPYRCDVCKYSTTTKGNLSIHMQSDKHLNNVQELQQQQAASGQAPLDLGAYIHAPPSVQVMTTSQTSRANIGNDHPSPTTPQPNESNKQLALTQDAMITQFLGMNPQSLAQQQYVQGGGVLHCCVCAVYSTDNPEEMLTHVNQDRSTTLPSDVSHIQGSLCCNLCQYQSKLKANFQLHTKTDKHMQKLQLVNHVREGGIQNEWRLTYVSVNSPVHLRCQACQEFFTSWHKLQAHVTSAKHQCLQIHYIKIRNLPQSSSILCNLCSTVLNNQQDMYAHLQSGAHLNSMLPLLDSEDGSIPDSLRDAMQVVTTQQEDNNPNEDNMTDAVVCCGNCSFTCSSTAALNSHMQKNHSQGPLLCPLCQVDCGASIESLKMHLTQVHNVSENGMQRLLPLIPSSNVSQHSISPPASVPADSTTPGQDESDGDSTGDVFSCPMCLVPFKTCDELYSHQGDTGHILQNDGSYLCWFESCSMTFPNVPSVQSHFRETHAKCNNNGSIVCISDKHAYKFRCTKCSLAFRTEEKLSAHSQYHQIRASTRCAICSRNFRSISSLRRHVEQEHVTSSNGVNEVENDSKEKVENEISNMEEHPDAMFNTPHAAEIAYQDASRKFKCHKCKMAFTGQAFLLRHQASGCKQQEKPSYSVEKYNDPNRPFKCEYCRESFTQRNILSVHNNSVSHLHKIKKLFEQQSPNTQITTEMLATIHKTQKRVEQNTPFQQYSQNVESTDSPKSQTPKPYRCNLCQNSSNHGTTFDIHLRSVGHMSRVGKLTELVARGEIDQNVPLIESPDNVTCNSGHLPPGVTAKQILQQMAKQAQSDVDKQQQAAMLAAQQMLSLAQIAPFMSQLSAAPGNWDSGPNQCPKCSNAFSTEVGLQMHMLQCFSTGLPPAMSALLNMPQSVNGNSNSKPTPIVSQDLDEEDYENLNMNKLGRNGGTAFKRMLENFGFEEVMQFNENLQQRKRKAVKIEEGEEEVKEKRPKINFGTEIGRVDCSHCNRHFSSIWVLKSHIEHVHGETIPIDLVEKMSEQLKEVIDKKEESVDVQTPTVDTQITSVDRTESFNSPTDSGLSSKLTMQSVSTTPQTSSTVTVTPSTPSKQPRAPSTMSNSARNNNMQQPNPQAMQAAMANLAMAGMTGGGQPFPFMPPGFPGGLNAFGGAAGAPFGFGMNPFLPFLMPGMNPSTGGNQASDPSEMLKAAAMNSGSMGNGSSDASILAAIAQNQAALMQHQQHAAANKGAYIDGGGRRARTRITDDQLKVLREYFDINNSPTEGQIEEMSRKSDLPLKVIKHWFRNTLFKERQRNKDSPYNFSIPPTVGIDIEEYEKTGTTKVINLNSLCEYPSKSDEIVLNPVVKEEVLEPIATCSTDEEKSGDEVVKVEKEEVATPDVKPIPMPMSIPNSTESMEATLRRVQTQLPPNMIPEHLASNPFSLFVAAQAAAAAASFIAPNTNSKTSTTPGLSPGPQMNMSGNSNGNCENFGSGMGGFGNGNQNQPGYAPGRRANRTRFTDSQLKTLQDFFDKQAYPKDDDLEFLSKKLQLSPRVIVVWFQNARQKARKVYENNPTSDGPTGFSKSQSAGGNYQYRGSSTDSSRFTDLLQSQHKDAMNSYKRSSSSRSPRSNSASISPDAQNNLACQLCNKQLQNVRELQEHMLIHSTNLNGDDQKAGGSLTDLLQDHANKTAETAAQNGEKTIVCVQQGKMRSRGGSVSSNSGTNNFNKRCPFCGILFHSKHSMTAHFQERHEDQCSKTTINIDLLPQAEEVPTITVATMGQNGQFGSTQNGASAMNNTPKNTIDVLKRLSEKAGILPGNGGLNYSLDLSRPIKVDPNDDHDLCNSASPNQSALSMSDFEDDMRSNFSQDSPSPCPSTSVGGSNVILTTQSFARPHNKRYRTHLSPMQIQVMKTIFQDYKTPSMPECETLGQMIALHKRVVQVWFQNARAKDKKVKTASSLDLQSELMKATTSLCKICHVTYDSHVTMQDHVFSQSHVNKLKEVLRSKGTEEGYPVTHRPKSSSVESMPPAKKCKESSEQTKDASTDLNAIMIAAANSNPYLQQIMGGYPGLVYDPNLYGTPVHMLQIPPSVQQNIIQSMQKSNKQSVRFTQDGKCMADLNSALSQKDIQLCREKDMEVGWGCRKCTTVFQSEKSLNEHRKQICQSSQPILRLIQTHFDCIACEIQALGTQKEFENHCASAKHLQNAP